jgi:hypothetical protein
MIAANPRDDGSGLTHVIQLADSESCSALANLRLGLSPLNASPQMQIGRPEAADSGDDRVEY